ncbi:MAG: hypothetical protein M3120_10585, partial [Pseudomonadota bacterium]|nr:hypothetical protein [Pseudomonadota bacterium]
VEPVPILPEYRQVVVERHYELQGTTQQKLMDRPYRGVMIKRSMANNRVNIRSSASVILGRYGSISSRLWLQAKAVDGVQIDTYARARRFCICLITGESLKRLHSCSGVGRP